MDCIKTVGWDPESCVRGGEVIAAGTPENIVKVMKSLIGHYLKPLLDAGM